MHQLQFNRNSFTSAPPQWLPMPEGRGAICMTRQECMALRRDYIRAYRKQFGEAPTLTTRIASGRYCVGSSLRA